MKNKLVWRLSKLPTVSELQELVTNKIITQEEARDVLFKTEKEEEGRDSESYKEEIKFLRGLIEKLSATSRSTVIEYIYAKPLAYPWYQPYVTWCSAGNLTNYNSAGVQSYLANAVNTVGSSGTLTYSTSDNALYSQVSGTSSFTDISTF